MNATMHATGHFSPLKASKYLYILHMLTKIGWEECKREEECTDVASQITDVPVEGM